jgi:hypothetical protein
MTKQNADPLNVNARLYRQVSKLLDDLEAPPVKRGRGKDAKEEDAVTMRERIAALTAIARIQTIFIQLRAEDNPDERRAGSAVRRYSGAFKNAAGGRKTGGRSGPAAVAAAEPMGDDFPDDEPAE